MSRVLSLVGAAHGQCRLSVVSATQIKLSPFNGQNLAINGNLEQVPVGGITAPNTGLAASTLYYVYAYMNAGAMALELSTTGHTTSSAGIEVKTGDGSRTLVGMLYTNTSTPGQFVSTTSSPTLLNWYNRRTIAGSAGALNGTVGSSAYTEINSGLRIDFLAWSDEAVDATAVGNVYGDTAGASLNASMSLDGAQWGLSVTTSDTGTGLIRPVSARAVALVSEGHHQVSAIGKASSGNAQFGLGTQLLTRG